MKPSSFRRMFLLVAVASALAVALPAVPGGALPVAADRATYDGCGRVFPDPHAYWPLPAQLPGQSPWAKGNENCKSVDFLGWDETLAGLNFLASDAMFGDFIEIYNLAEHADFAEVMAKAGVDGMSAGLPEANLERDKAPMYLIRVTDEQDTAIPIADRQHLAYALSIHGIERAGVEGGIRAIEDLATWASCEKHGADSPAHCEQENAGLGDGAADTPHPILETMPEDSTTAGAALKQQSVWFMLSNPDGWRRGDKQDGGFFYQRYNGNGMDMNRDWPAHGFTFRPYTPWSEPETRAVGEALQAVKPTWTAGIDLHGQLIDRAFSFTLIGGSERPFDKDRRVLQFTKGAWADAEQRLAWSPVIKPNDAPRSCVELGVPPNPRPEPGCDPLNRMYGVQWGTIWDTIDYTVTGALGDWMDSPIGLNADGIDNEMSMSHLSNCGVGTCYLTEFEQLHVDGNKSLIYAQMHYSLIPEDTTFAYRGKAAYLHNDERITHAGEQPPSEPGGSELPPQEGFDQTLTHAGGGNTVYEFEVLGPDRGVYNGGLTAKFTSSNLTGVTPNSFLEFSIDQYRPEEENPNPAGGDEDWQVVNSYFNQSPIYLQAGAQIDVNYLEPGKYRVRVSGTGAGDIRVQGTFTEEEAWPDPGQVAYDVSNMDFFTMLRRHVQSRDKLTPLPVNTVLAGGGRLKAFDTLVVTDDAFLPGYVEPEKATAAQKPSKGTVFVPAPGAGVRTDATSAYYEFDVNKPQGSLKATVTSETVLDPDLYLQKQTGEDESGEPQWSGDLATGETGRDRLETLQYGNPTPGHYRLEVHNWAGAPGPADVRIEFTGRDAINNPSDYTNADRDRLAKLVRTFVRGGGNLVLTDDSLRVLEWMGLTPDGSVVEQAVYAGHVQFSTDGGQTATYDDPLAANVNQPGAAEGDGHRHQVAEPVPTGYAIQDEDGGDFNSHPQWSVERQAFEDAGGRVVGVVSGSNVTLGEIALGDGVVRVLGSLLPQPTEEFDHPYGLASYGVTYSGYEVFRNLLDWGRDTRATDPDPDPDPGPDDRSADDDDSDDDTDDGSGGEDDASGGDDGATSPADDSRPILPATGGGIALALAALGTGLFMRRRLRT